MAMGLATGHAKEPDVPPCNEDAMIVFDASGSMSGTVGLGIATPITRIDEVRAALGAVLPSATKFRRVGLITYGPGPYQQCNVRLDLKPMPDAAAPIMGVVNSLTPAGRTPLTSAVRRRRQRCLTTAQAWRRGRSRPTARRPVAARPAISARNCMLVPIS